MRQTPVPSCLFGKAKDFLSRRHLFMSITNRFYFTAVQIKVKVIIAIVAICHCSCHRFCRACPPFPFPEKVALRIPQCEPFVKWILNFFAANPAFFVKSDVLSDLPRVIAGANSRLSTRGSFPSPALLPRKNPILPLDIYRKTWYTLPVAAPDGRVPSHRKAAVRGKSGHHRAG